MLNNAGENLRVYYEHYFSPYVLYVYNLVTNPETFLIPLIYISCKQDWSALLFPIR